MVPVKAEKQRQVLRFMDVTLSPQKRLGGYSPAPALQGDTQEITVLLTLSFYAGHFTQEYNHHFLGSCSPNHPLGELQTETRIHLAYVIHYFIFRFPKYTCSARVRE